MYSAREHNTTGDDADVAGGGADATAVDVDVLLREMASSRRALLVTALRQPKSLQKFVDTASARGFAPR